MIRRSQSTFGHYVDSIGSILRRKTHVAYMQVDDYNAEPPRAVDLPVYEAVVTSDEYAKLLDTFRPGVTSTGNVDTDIIMLTLYDELPRQNLELPTAFANFVKER